MACVRDLGVVLMLAVVVCCSPAPVEPARGPRIRKAYATESHECTNRVCAGVRASAVGPCVRHCISPTCYLSVYGSEGLEEGEIDQKADVFRRCAGDEIDAEMEPFRLGHIGADDGGAERELEGLFNELS
eukprot:Amastigsp_a514533_21.p2 type:complete len:130 gc:universal Amastigsp_a514533_21:56-445(+)